MMHVALTARALREEQEKIVTNGYLVKPIELGALSGEMKRCLARATSVNR